MRGGVVAALLVATVVTMGVGSADACLICGTHSLCVWSPSGSNFCAGNGFSCTQFWPCSGGGRRFFPADGVALFVTFHEDDARERPLVGVGGGRRVRGAGAAASLDEARRVVSEALGRPGGQRVVSGRFIVGEGPYRIAFRSPRGDGWAVQVDPGPTGVQVSLREHDVTRTSRLCARETIGEGDALVARVRVEGRPYLAVVRAHVVRGTGEAAKSELEALQQPFYDALRGLGEGPDARWAAEPEQ